MKRCKIVMYHYVKPIKNSKFTKIKGLEINDFIKQIDYFKKNYHFIIVEELLDCIYKSRSISPKSILLTFDDGFKDHYLHVFPILKKLRIQGLFFPSALPLEKNHVLDVHKIHFVLANCKNIHELSEELIELIKTYKDEYDLQSVDSYISAINTSNRFDDDDTIFIKRTLQTGLPKKARKKFLNIFFQKYVTEDEVSFSKELYLSNEQISEMIENGMYFGSHSYSHEWFENLSEDELETELEKSSHFLTKNAQ